MALTDPAAHTKWFDAKSSVIECEDGTRHVFVGGRLVGSFGAKDYAERNVMLIAVSEEPKAHLGRIADAFGVSPETLRLLRELAAREGIEAVTRRKRGGSAGRGLTARDRAKLLASFEAGATIEGAWEQIRRRASRATVGRLKKEWDARKAVSTAEPEVEIAREQTRLQDAPVVALAAASAVEQAVPEARSPHEPQPKSAEEVSTPAASAVEQAVPEARSPHEPQPKSAGDEANAPPSDEEGSPTQVRPEPVRSSRWVQHLGAWLMLAMLQRLGLYDAAGEACANESKGKALRIAIDALVCALTLGEGCVEGVRRLMTPSGHALVRANRAPSATWVRRVFGSFAGHEKNAARLHFAMARRYVKEAHAETERDVVVFYVDNHLRPYTGQQTVRKGWRMQDKRVRPGVTDVYVHDEVGNPVLRLTDTTNGSLTAWLSRVAKELRVMVGPEARIVLAFDRGGAFPEQLASLRDEGFELVTYERKPYPLLASSAFDIAFEHDGERFEASDANKNLGSGHGRVRRVALRGADGRQVNLLAAGELSVSELYAILRGRWVQENGFHHQVHRWGINQLDGRTTQPVDPDTVIPNPERRRLDRNIRLARVTAGLARNELAGRPKDDPRRKRWEAILTRAIAREHDLLDLRPSTPKHAPLRETELADKLVRHTGDYKMALDSVRIACANAESDLAALLAEAMVIPTEAKKLLANVLHAPGHVVVGQSVITVRLAPAANRSEREAIVSFLARCNRMNLTLPGDPARRRLRFQSQTT
ncbi:MAG: hypothetical protein ACXWAW_19755 [Usitatibacter sp.]